MTPRRRTRSRRPQRARCSRRCVALRASIATKDRPIRWSQSVMRWLREFAARRGDTLPGRPASAIPMRWCRGTAILAVADETDDRLFQLAHVLAAGARAIWPADAARQRTALASFPQTCAPVSIWLRTAGRRVRAGAGAGRRRHDPRLESAAGRPARGGRYPARLRAGRAQAGAYPLEWLLVERSVSVNTAAAGGNASLMTLG